MAKYIMHLCIDSNLYKISKKYVILTWTNCCCVCVLSFYFPSKASPQLLFLCIEKRNLSCMCLKTRMHLWLIMPYITTLSLLQNVNCCTNSVFSLCKLFEFTLRGFYKLHVLRSLMLHIFAAKMEYIQDINNLGVDPSPENHLSKVCAI